MSTEARLAEIIRASPRMMTVMRAIRGERLPQWRIFAGAVYQTAWNGLTGRDPDHGVRDYDVIYFDPDPSWDAEDAVIRRVAAALPDDLRGAVEVRNQSRVHLWFPQKFGRPYAPLTHADDALSRAVATVHALGVRLEDDDTISVAAPLGMDDLFALRFRAGPGGFDPAVVAAKAGAARARWPEVTIDATPWTPAP
ncbi:MAG: nucleotidyltransferase family protein [Brevundimonas sp.]|uniref:nucleotidyltransferase family protein n=1 Tax=Brevundimonas sp. TaxID=1871086 RepID=UPI00121A010D|nr:nucleotidyltransferase family protein [Brevundimonas sp.]RZJ17413.1 MAG: nucleotidyltransferase family protein [Brevundimonas sp.]